METHRREYKLATCANGLARTARHAYQAFIADLVLRIGD